MLELSIEYLSPKDLIPYQKNNKKHDKKQISALAENIAEFDFDVPIVIDENNNILKGHCRRESAIKLKLKQVPVIKRVGLSEMQKKAIRIADNKLSESEWDLDNLLSEMQELKDDEFDLNLTGFDDMEINKMLKKIEEDNAIESLDEMTKEETEEEKTLKNDEFHDEDLVTFSCYMKKENRDILLKAINHSKQCYNSENVEQALVNISEVFLSNE